MSKTASISLLQTVFYAAAADAEIVPPTDQQTDKCGEGQTGADDLHDHACVPASMQLPPGRLYIVKVFENRASVFKAGQPASPQNELCCVTRGILQSCPSRCVERQKLHVSLN